MDPAKREEFAKDLTAAEDWLFSDEGFDASTEKLKEKLDALKETGEPPSERKKEREEFNEYTGAPPAGRFLKKLNQVRSACKSDGHRYAIGADKCDALIKKADDMEEEMR